MFSAASCAARLPSSISSPSPSLPVIDPPAASTGPDRRPSDRNADQIRQISAKGGVGLRQNKADIFQLAFYVGSFNASVSCYAMNWSARGFCQAIIGEKARVYRLLPFLMASLPNLLRKSSIACSAALRRDLSGSAKSGGSAISASTSWATPMPIRRKAVYFRSSSTCARSV